MKHFNQSVSISGKNQLYIDKLINRIKKSVEIDFHQQILIIPHSKSYLVDKVYENFKVLKRKEDYEHVSFTVKGKKDKIDRFLNVLKEEKHS